MLGENPLCPLGLDLVDVFPPALTPPMTKAFRLLVDRASAQLEQAKRDQKAFADESRRPLELSAVDLVWVSTRHMAARGCPKLQQRHIGPCRILERIGPAAYKLQLPPSMPIHPVFHVSLLSPHRPRPKDMTSPSDWAPVAEAPDGLLIYEVESILHQRGEGDTARYLVKWEGFPESDGAWELFAPLDTCAALLGAFAASRNAQLRPQVRRAPPKQTKLSSQPSCSLAWLTRGRGSEY
ncbi:hypothetical protein ACSSS7_006863 [Eimeria intestinalis]